MAFSSFAITFTFLINLHGTRLSLLSRFRNPTEYVAPAEKMILPEDISDNLYLDLVEEIPELKTYIKQRNAVNKTTTPWLVFVATRYPPEENNYYVDDDKAEQEMTEPVTEPIDVVTVTERIGIPTVTASTKIPTVSKSSPIPAVSDDTKVPIVTGDTETPTDTEYTEVSIIANNTQVPIITALTDIRKITTYCVEIPAVRKCYGIPRVNESTEIPTITDTTVKHTNTSSFKLKKYGILTGPHIATCYTCGLNASYIPRSALCHDAFESDDDHVNTMAKYFRTKCYRNTKSWAQKIKPFTFRGSHSLSRGFRRRLYGPYIGGCFKRFMDVGTVYTQRGCRTWWPTYSHYTNVASHRYMRLEALLRHKKNACVVSPHASLTPFSRTVSLFVRYHVCVCEGKYCNGAGSRVSFTLLVLIYIVL